MTKYIDTKAFLEHMKEPPCRKGERKEGAE